MGPGAVSILILSAQTFALTPRKSKNGSQVTLGWRGHTTFVRRAVTFTIGSASRAVHDSVGRGSVSQFSRGPAIVVLLGASRRPEIHLDSPARARDRKRVPRFPLGARVPACRFERISLDSRWSNRVLQRSSSVALSWSVPFLNLEPSFLVGCLWCMFNVCGLHHPWYSQNALPRLPKVRWFSGFPPLNEKKDQATSGSYQNATEPNQFNRHTYPLHL